MYPVSLYPESLAFGVRPSSAAGTSPAASAFLRPRTGALRRSHPPVHLVRQSLRFGGIAPSNCQASPRAPSIGQAPDAERVGFMCAGTREFTCLASFRADSFTD